MEENKPFKSISELINEIKNYADRLDSGKLSVSELSNVLSSARNLHERVVVLKFKAEENLIREDENQYKGRFKLNLKKDNQLSLDEVISDTVQEKLEHAQTNFLDDVDDSAHIEKQVEPIEQTSVEAINSVNDAHTESRSASLAEQLKKTSISDLKQSIGLNAKFLFMNDLFKGENKDYNNAVDLLNKFSSFEEAKNYLAELKSKFDWDDEHISVIRFTELVERRYL